MNIQRKNKPFNYLNRNILDIQRHVPIDSMSPMGNSSGLAVQLKSCNSSIQQETEKTMSLLGKSKSPFGLGTSTRGHYLKNNYIFNYVMMFIFALGIIMYIYELVIDSQDPDYRPFHETIWVWVMFILLIIGFILSSFSF
jgi:hypothetical protein